MDKKQYNNIIDWTQKTQPETQTEDSLTAVRAVCDNMGVALPQGDLAQVAETLATDDYMYWHSCTPQEAREAADNGIPTIGISEDSIVLLAATDEEQSVTTTAAVMALANNENNNVTNMAYYSYGSCTVTTIIPIETTIPVQGITMCDSTYTMNVGENACLSYSIHPANATNKSVVWCSCNPTVATINSLTGKITAKKVGTTQITVITNDGCFVASCLLSVFIDTAIVKKDGNFNKVVFANSGKVWYCINHDMLFDDNNMYNSILIDRSNKNYYVKPGINNVDLRTYSDDELKLLYAIDPYGVADYVNRYASGLFYEGGLKSILDYKDSVFELLFNKKPRYFTQTHTEHWQETDETDDLTKVISESESYFGMHSTLDPLRLAIKAIDFLKNALCLIIPGEAVDTLVEISGSLLKIGILYHYEEYQMAVEEIVSLVIQEVVPDEPLLENVFDVMSTFKSYFELIDTLKNKPRYYCDILDYCINKVNYMVILELKNGEKLFLEDIKFSLTN